MNYPPYPLTPLMKSYKHVNDHYQILSRKGTIIDKIYMTKKEFKESPYSQLKELK